MVTAMQEQIKILVELQKIDSEIHSLKVELAEIPLQQKKLDEDFEKKKTRLKTADAAYKAEQMKQKEKEVDLASREEKIKKLQGQLFSLKSNKEYSAMELEIKGLKADKSVLEEEILMLFDGVEQAKAAVAKEKDVLAVEEKKVKEGSDILKKRSEELNAQILLLEEKRKAYTPNIEPKLIAQYEKILKGRDGLALVPMIDKSCSGCNLRLTSQTANEIQMQDKLMFCESCARILYWMP